ncbi:MAG: hypothetical protein ACHP6H_04885 [Legionellales bacterium]
MKNILRITSLLLLTLLFDSCHNQGDKPQAAETTSVKAVSRDSVIYNGLVIYLEPIDSNEFLKLPAFDLDTNTLYYKTKVIDDPEHVYFVDSIIPVLKFANGDSVILRPSQETSISGQEHRYLKKIDALNSFFVSNPNDLSYDFSIWNRATGKETRTFSYPQPSPDGQNLLCFDFCVNGDYANNGFQIFANDKDSLRKKWQVIPSGWGPLDCRWKDNHTIYMKTSYWDWDSKNFIVKYVSLKLPNFTK